MIDLEKKLDCLIQEIASKKPCYYCNCKKSVGHHLNRRSNYLTRWNKDNILSVCMFCHQKIHEGTLKEPSFIEVQNDFKDYLLKNGITKQEFMEQKYFELTRTSFEYKNNQQNQQILYKPKEKSKKSKYILEKQKEYRKQQYQKLKEYKKNLKK